MSTGHIRAECNVQLSSSCQPRDVGLSLARPAIFPICCQFRGKDGVSVFFPTQILRWMLKGIMIDMALSLHPFGRSNSSVAVDSYCDAFPA